MEANSQKEVKTEIYALKYEGEKNTRRGGVELCFKIIVFSFLKLRTIMIRS